MSLLRSCLFMASRGSGFLVSYYVYSTGTALVFRNVVMVPWTAFVINAFRNKQLLIANGCSDACKETRRLKHEKQEKHAKHAEHAKPEDTQDTADDKEMVSIWQVIGEAFYVHTKDCPYYADKTKVGPTVPAGSMVSHGTVLKYAGMQLAGFVAYYALVRASVCMVNLVFANIPRMLEFTGHTIRGFLTSK